MKLRLACIPLFLASTALSAKEPPPKAGAQAEPAPRVDYSQIKTAQDRLKERLGGRINIRESDKMSVADWRGVVSGLGPNEISLLQRRYPAFAAHIGEAAAPSKDQDPARREPGSAGAVSADAIRAAGGNPNTAARGGKSPSASDDPGSGGEKTGENAVGPGEEAPAGPSKERRLGKGEVERIGDKTRGLLQDKDELFGPKKEPGAIPESAKRPGEKPLPERSASAPSGKPRPISPPDARAAALEAIRRYQDSGAVPNRPNRVSSEVPSLPPPPASLARTKRSPALTLASAAPSYGRGAPPPSETAAFPETQTRAKSPEKAEKSVETPFGRMTPEEEAELQSFLNMIDEVAATGALDSRSANDALIGAEAALDEDSALEKPLEDIRFILEKSGRKLAMSEQSYALAAARRLGFEFNPKQAWNLLWALEKGTPPPPRVEKERTLWQRIVRWLKRLLLRMVRLFGR